MPPAGYSSVEGVQVGQLTVFVAGATHDAKRVKTLAYDLRSGRWHRLPRTPLRWRAGQVTLAAGDRVIVWGGASNTGQLRDGAVLEAGHWRRMARAPVAGFDRAAVWTGRQMIVPTGAAYDLETNRWRAIAPAPFRARAAVWTGRRVLILGARVAAAYDPRRDRWRTLTPPPIRAMGTPRAVSTGSRMISSTARAARRTTRGATTGTCSARHRSPTATASPPSWDGRRMLVWGGVRNEFGDCFLADGAAFAPARHRWRRLPPSPLAPRNRHAAVPLRGGMVVWPAAVAARPLADGAIFR